MKSFYVQSPQGGADIVIELGFWDMTKLLFGRNLRAAGTVIRFQPAYLVMNVDASPDEVSTGRKS